jgi:uridine kinase
MQHVRFIAVIGGSGSGKTWLAKELVARLGDQAAHLSLDHFYRDLSHLSPAQRALTNFDDPAAIDWDSLQNILKTLASAESAQVPTYDFAQHLRKKETSTLECRPFVIVEGLWLLHPECLRESFALSVFVDCPEALRLQRRIERDQITRGRSEESILNQFAQQVQPMHLRYVEPQREFANYCIHSPLSQEDFDLLLRAIVFEE